MIDRDKVGAKIGVALIGPGQISQAHELGYREAVRARADRGRLRCAVRGCPATSCLALHCAAYTDYLRAARRSRRQAVDITLPHNLHYPVARAALEQGKHVLIEKPMAGTSARVPQLIDTGAHGRESRSPWRRTRALSPPISRPRALLEAARLGEPRLIRTFIYG